MNIKVKALEWAEHPSGKPLWRAHAPSIGWYGASAIIPPASWRFDGLDETVTHDVADIDAAKAAAQADYERRILSAIEPSSDMREAVEAATKLVSQWEAFEAGYGNQEEAYYKLAKYARPHWEALRTALRSLTRAKP